MASSWSHGKTKYGGGGSPDSSDVVPKYGGSRTSGLDASAPIWTPSPKHGHHRSSAGNHPQHAGDWSRQASYQSYSPSIPAQSPNSGFSSSHHHNGFGGQGQQVANRSTAGVGMGGMGSPKYHHQQSTASYHHQGYQHQQGYYYPQQQQQQGAQWQPSSWSGSVSVSPPTANGLGSPVMMPQPGPGGQQIYNYQPASPSPLGSSPSSPGTGVFLPSSLSSSRRPSKSSTITGMDSAAICLPDELF